MNKTFKIVFNKARGALMVANEITSSVQKKGVKLIVAATAVAACGASTAGTGIANDTVHFATDATISTDAPSGEPNRYSGIAASEKGQATTVSVADGATLTITGTLENFPDAERLYLINAVEGASVTTSGNIVGKLSADTSSGELRGVRANKGSVTINGNLTLVSQGGQGGTSGVEAWYGGRLTFNGATTSISLTNNDPSNDPDHSSGTVISNAGGSSRIDFNTNTFADIIGTTKTALVQGLYALHSTTNFNGNAFLSVKSYSDNAIGVQAVTDADSPIDTIVNFNGKDTQIKVSTVYDNDDAPSDSDDQNVVYGAYSWRSELNFNGNTSIEAAGTDAPTYGVIVIAEEGNTTLASINFRGDTTRIQVSSDSGTAVGAMADGPSTINFTGEKATIVVESNTGDAYGVDAENKGLVYFQSDAEIDVTAHGEGENKAAYGVYVDEYGDDANGYFYGTAKFDRSLTITATADGEAGYAFGIYNKPTDAVEITSTPNDGVWVAEKTTVRVSGTELAQGIFVDGKLSQVTTGEVDIVANSTTGFAFGVAAQNGGSVTIGADGKTSTIAATHNSNYGSAVALYTDSNASLTVKGEAISLASSGYGVRAKRSAATLGTKDTSVVHIAAETCGINTNAGYVRVFGEMLDINTQNRGISAQYGSVIELNSKDSFITTALQGLDAWQSTVNINGNATINVTGSAFMMAGVCAYGDSDDVIDTAVNFKGDTTRIKATASSDNVSQATAAYATSGGVIRFTGKNVFLEAESDAGGALAVLAQNKGRFYFDADATLTAKSHGNGLDNAAFGVWIDGYNCYGIASFRQSLAISSSADNEAGHAYGIYVMPTYDVTQTTADLADVEATGKTSITVSGTAVAGGLWADNNNSDATAKISMGEIDIAAISATGSAYGVVAKNGGTITLGAAGTTSVITATTETGNAIGMDIDAKSSVTLNGATVINAATALQGDGSLTVGDGLTANGKVTGFTGKVTIAGGTTTLTEASGYFGGEVEVSGGTLVADSITANSLTLTGGTLQTSLAQVYDGATLESTNFSASRITLTSGQLTLTNNGDYTSAFAKALSKSLNDKTTVTFANATLKSGEKAELVNGLYQNNVTVTLENQDTAVITTPKGAGVKTLALTNAAPVTLSESSQLTLIGDTTGGDFIAQATQVTLADGAVLTLGSSAADATAGALAPVTLENATLNIANTTAIVASLAGSGTVNVGEAGGAGASVHVGSLKMAGGTIFVDPAYNAHAVLTVDEVENNTLKVNVVAGTGSLVTIGATDAASSAAVERLGFADRSAVVYTAQALNLAGGSLHIADGLSASNELAHGQVAVGTGGALIVDQTAIGSSKVFNNATLKFSDDGLLGIANATVGTLTLADSVAGLEREAVFTDNPFVEVASITKTGLTTQISATNGLGALASTGLQAMTRRADSVLAQTIADRTSVDQDYATGTALWVDVTGERYQADKMDNNASFKSDMGYGAFGGDFAITEDISAGAAIQYGKGTVRCSVSSIKNSIDSYGITAYGSMKFGDAKVVAEASYIKNENDITSSQTALNQSVDTEVYSFGVRGLHRFTAGQFQFVPSVGVRVSRLNTDAMKVGAVNIKKQEQTLVQVPIALRINGFEQNAGGWSVAPSFKIAYVPTFGDKEISVLGADQTVIDTSPVQGDFGIRAQKGNLLINANFMVGGGKDGTSSVGGKAGLKYVF